MRSVRFRSVAVPAGAVLAVALQIFSVPDGWGAEHSQHEKKMMRHAGPTASKPGLALPKGWRFALPTGSLDAGRKAFADFECFKCHLVQGEDFPAPLPEQGGVGPDLSGMGPMHPPEYFAEAIIDPNASAVWRIKHHKEETKGYLGPDGKTKMPSYNDSMTVRQLIDLVAYLKSLAGPAEHKH